MIVVGIVFNIEVFVDIIVEEMVFLIIILVLLIKVDEVKSSIENIQKGTLIIYLEKMH